MLRVSSVEVVSFDADPDSRLIIRLETGGYFDDKVRVRVYPYADRIVTTAGLIAFDSTRVDGFREGLKFQGAGTGQLRYPLATDIVLTNTLATVDANLVEFNPTYEYDTNRDLIRVLDVDTPVEAYGAVDALYNAPYERYFYRPDYSPGVIRVGSIIARRGKNVAVLPIDSESINNEDYVEVYRVISPILLDSSRTAPGDLQSAWEVPPGYPDSVIYPGTNVEAPTRGVVVDERVHEYGYVNRSGRMENQVAFIRYEHPYEASPGYRPDWSLNRSLTPPDGYASAYGQIPWDDIIAKLRIKYPGLAV